MSDSHNQNVLGALVLGLADRVREATTEAAGQGSAAPAVLMSLLEFMDGSPVDGVSKVVGLTPSGAVRLVDRLAEAGYVKRFPGRDNRRVAVVLTGDGYRAAKRVLAARQTVLEDLLPDLSDEEQATFGRLCDKLVAGLTRRRMAEREEGREPGGGWLCRLCDLRACEREEGRCPAHNAALEAMGGGTGARPSVAGGQATGASPIR